MWSDQTVPVQVIYSHYVNGKIDCCYIPSNNEIAVDVIPLLIDRNFFGMTGGFTIPELCIDRGSVLTPYPCHCRALQGKQY